MNMGPQGMVSSGQGMNSAGQVMGSGPVGPRTMGSGSLGRGAMNNSLMPGGGGMVRAYYNEQLFVFIWRTVFRAHNRSSSLYSRVCLAPFEQSYCSSVSRWNMEETKRRGR